MTFLSRILGLVRDYFVARYFGANDLTDAFLVAFRIPNFSFCAADALYELHHFYMVRLSFFQLFKGLVKQARTTINYFKSTLYSGNSIG
jgi:hypothetical protein